MRLALLTASLVLGSVFALNAQPAPALRIVILEGEDAVNIIQQTTAVRARRDVCRRRANAHGGQHHHRYVRPRSRSRRDGIDAATSHPAEITAAGRSLRQERLQRVLELRHGAVEASALRQVRLAAALAAELGHE